LTYHRPHREKYLYPNREYEYPRYSHLNYEYEYPIDNEKLSNYDYNNDGTLNRREVELSQLLHDIEIKSKKLNAQKRMAWVSLVMIGIVTFVLFTPAISESRIDVLSDLLAMFYISCAGITGAYVGVTAWISRK